MGDVVAPLEAVNAGNAAFIEELYESYRQDPASVDAQWRLFFAGFELASADGKLPRAVLEQAMNGVVAPPRISRGPAHAVHGGPDLQINDLIHSYRELGHLVANLDPLGHNVTHHPLLELSEFGLTEKDLSRMATCPNFLGIEGDRCTLGQLIDALRETYCGTFAVEYMEMRDPEQRQWLQEHMEPTRNHPRLSVDQKKDIMRRLIETEDFELFLQRRFPTTKRFSNEGGDALINLLDGLIATGSETGVDEILFGMAHRGRINILAHILNKPYEMIMAEVLDRPTNRLAGDGDVKYHLGYACDHTLPTGQKIHLSLAANPSHLEIVSPVVEGMCRAKQNRKGDTLRARTIPVLMHGDAAFTGQGVVAETLYLSELEAYRTGGTIHVIINNQIGFTTNPSDGRFTRYPTDIAKAMQSPVFHVNADDPEACLHAATLAMKFRQQFKGDVIIDLVCYRRRGHNEMDDASVTQPVMAREIAAHPTVRTLYAQRLQDEGTITPAELSQMAETVKNRLEKALETAQAHAVVPNLPPAPYGPWAKFLDVPRDTKDWSLKTGVDKRALKEFAKQLCAVPEGFNIHPAVKKMMDRRLESVEQEQGINWGTGEMLALASILEEGMWVRLTGQDVCRGTFSHRNAVWFDHETGQPYVPLANFADEKSRFMIINTMLSELAVVGFEYGFASADPQSLVMWEAQFGDFVNMAQPIIDQFISSAESKWGKYNGLVMLLPHGYEGSGPEHSHARLERFLQLCAEDNWQVCYPTTPAQYFHLLRRQINRSFRKPLIVMSPKSLLNNRLCVSTLDEFAVGGYQDLLDETDTTIDKSKVRRVLMCSGKIYYDLLAERIKRGIKDIAIIRFEQIYPFPAQQLTEVSKQYPAGVDLYWVQEEPRNNGVYPFIGPKLHYNWISMKKLEYIGRKPSASPAAGSHEKHVREQDDIIRRALRSTEPPKHGHESSGEPVREDLHEHGVEMRTHR